MSQQAEKLLVARERTRERVDGLEHRFRRLVDVTRRRRRSLRLYQGIAKTCAWRRAAAPCRPRQMLDQIVSASQAPTASSRSRRLSSETETPAERECQRQDEESRRCHVFESELLVNYERFPRNRPMRATWNTACATARVSSGASAGLGWPYVLDPGQSRRRTSRDVPAGA
jgi:hypothetical protein